MTATKYSIHEVANLFPMMSDEEFSSLVEDIKSNGQHEPITIYQNQIIDGRNRFAACMELDLEPKVREWDGRGSMVDYVISLNLKRRQLTGAQRAAVAVDMLPLLESEARVRQKLAAEKTNANRGNSNADTLIQKVVQANGLQNHDGLAATKAAKIMGTNRQYVTDAKHIQQEAPEVFDMMKRGEVNMPKAKQLAAIPEVTRTKIFDNLPMEEDGKTRVCEGCGELRPVGSFKSTEGRSPSNKCNSCRYEATKVSNTIKSEAKKIADPADLEKHYKKKIIELELKVKTLENQLEDERRKHMVERTELAGEIFTIKANLTMKGIEL